MVKIVNTKITKVTATVTFNKVYSNFKSPICTIVPRGIDARLA